MEAETIESGDLRETFERYELPLFHLARRIVGDSEKARDVVQETFLRLCQVGEQSVEGKVVEWLFTVCRNRAVDVTRRDRRLKPLADREAADDEDPSASGSQLIQRKRDVRALLELVSELPDKQRRLIIMRFYDGWSYRQMSESLGMSVSNVGYQIHVGVKTLRKRLQQRNRCAGETK